MSDGGQTGLLLLGSEREVKEGRRERRANCRYTIGESNGRRGSFCPFLDSDITDGGVGLGVPIEHHHHLSCILSRIKKKMEGTEEEEERDFLGEEEWRREDSCCVLSIN